jgi:LacI family transcriptional regulator
MPVSIYDIAKRANVSSSTVSRVLNGKGLDRIALDTQERVRRIAREMDYRPNLVARSLRARRTNIVGLYLGFSRYVNPAADLPFFAQILAGLQRGCEHHDKNLLLNLASKAGSEEEAYNSLLGGTIDGLIVYAPPDDPLLARLAREGGRLPVVVLVDAPGTPALPCVVADDYGGGRLMAEHLYERGHRHVLFHAPFSPIAAGERRYRAFQATADELGMQVELARAAERGQPLGPADRAVFDRPAGTRPTAVAAWSDGGGDTFIAFFQEKGLRVPEDVAFIGVDGIPPHIVPANRLTTVRAPWKQVARTAVDVLMDRIAGKPVAEETVLPVELIQGDTT